MIVITANRGDSANTDHQCSLKAVAYWLGTQKVPRYSQTQISCHPSPDRTRMRCCSSHKGLAIHFMICHSNKCHRPRTSSCHKEQRGGASNTFYDMP